MKEYFERNKVFIAIIIAVFIIGGFIYLSNYSSSPQISEQETSEKEEPRLVGTEPVSVFNLNWSVLEMRQIGRELKGRLDIWYNPEHKTEGKFIEVVIRVENEGLISIWLPEFRPGFWIQDEKGRIYEEIRVGIGRHKWYSEVPSELDELSPYLDEIARNEIKPGIPYIFSSFFEVASDSANCQLLVGVDPSNISYELTQQ